jgi:sterol desaturase/sphingolipid hydroxylase (fatty acid hydroxylase superfamily)
VGDSGRGARPVFLDDLTRVEADVGGDNMTQDSIFTMVWMDAVAQVGLLLASLVIFTVGGAAILWVTARKKLLRDIFRTMFPFARYSHGQLKVDLWMLAASRLLWFPILNAIFITILSLDVQSILVEIWGARKPVFQHDWRLLLIQLGLSYISLELSGYWAHRFLHTKGLLWYTHRAHHSAEVLTFLVGGRGHPLEHIVFLVVGLAFGSMTMGMFLFYTGTSLHASLPAAMIALGLFGAVMDKISHSELPMSFGPLDYVFMSARMHQIHHSAELHHRDRNFGGTMSLFDWVFGTAYRPERDEQFRFGLSPDEIGTNNPHLTLRALYLEPLALARKDLQRRDTEGKFAP